MDPEFATPLRAMGETECHARWMNIDGAFEHERLLEFFEAQIEDAPRTKAKPQKAATAQ